VVAEGDTLVLGSHTLSFIAAPMVHWPEVIMTYDSEDGVLFSADAFGKFGALDACDEWACEARRYYFGIVGKYGAQVQGVLKKTAALDISIICPLHGPVLSENLSYYLDLYNTWSSYKPESEGVCIAYATIYGNTRQGAEMLAEELNSLGVKVSIMDLARCDIHEAVEDAFRYDRLVLAASTYNGGVFTPMREFIAHLTERNYQNRKVAFIENGSWAAMATKTMKAMLEGSKNLSFAETEVKITSSVNDTTIASIKALAKELSEM
jgi:flavorubredoxin